jgi:methyl-accepting chemotaxis protein
LGEQQNPAHLREQSIMNLTIKAKLILLVMVGSLAVCAVGCYALLQVRIVAGELQQSSTMAQTVSSLEDASTVAQVSFKTQVQNWKDVLLRGNDKALYDRYFKQFEEKEAATREALQKLATGFATIGQDAGPVRKALEEHARLGEKYRTALKAFDPADPEAGKKVDLAVRGMDRPLSDSMSTLSETVSRYVAGDADSRTQRAAKVIEQATLWLLAGVITTLLALLLGGWRVVRSITRPLEDLRSTAQYVETSGDLTRRLPIHRNDELAQCARAVNALLENFQRIVMQISEQSGDVAKQADAIKNEVRRVVHSIGVQDSATTAVSSAIRDLSASVEQVGEYTQQNSEISRQSHAAVGDGRAAAQQGNTQLQHTTVRVQESVRTLDELGSHASEISGIVQTVREIADQTNLLALNASIEAARAGQSGQGFAVVADEVAKLAEKTTRSTEKIRTLVQQINTSAVNSIKGMRLVVTDFEEQVRLSARIETAIDAVQGAASQSSEGSQAINEALRRETSSSQTIATQIEQISSMCAESNRAIGNVNESSQRLHQLTVALIDNVSRFRVK